MEVLGYIILYMSLREKVLKLRSKGKTYKEIAKICKCAKSTVEYYCSPTSKNKCIRRKKEWRKRNPINLKLDTFKSSDKKQRNGRKFRRKDTPILEVILNCFKRRNMLIKMNELKITVADVKSKFGDNPVCYLSGRKLNWNDSSTFTFDHIVPASRGGPSTLANLGVCHPQINRCKNDLTPEELIELCKEILKYNGYEITKNK